MMSTKVITVTEKQAGQTHTHTEMVYQLDPYTITFIGIAAFALVIKWLCK